MKKIIALYGPQNRGKTTTLKILIDLLSVVSDANAVWKEDGEAWGWFKISARTVSVCSSGDNADIVKENIAEFKDCDIFVSATRTKGGSVSEIEKLASKENVEIDWIEKFDDENKNKLIAACLFQKVLKTLFDFNSL